MTLVKREQSELAVATAVHPRAVVAEAQEWADTLMEIVEAKKLYAMIGGKKHLEAEAWETIIRFDHASPVPAWSREIKDDNGKTVGYMARVEIIKNGEVISAGEMPCGFEEYPCRGKEGIARHRAATSSAQTWAMAKAARLKYSWVVVLAGYEPTPAAEMYQDSHAGEPEVAERGLCPTHKVAFLHRQGTSKAGKPYDFWACPEKNADGSYCQERPSDVVDAAVADVEAQTKARPAGPSGPAAHPAQKSQAEAWDAMKSASGDDDRKPMNTIGDLYQAAYDTWKIQAAQTLRELTEIKGKAITVQNLAAEFGSFRAAFDAIKTMREATGEVIESTARAVS